MRALCVGLLPLLSLLVATRASANAGPYRYLKGRGTRGQLVAPDNAPAVHVAHIDLKLDLRRKDRGWSSASYVLMNQSDRPFSSRVVFVASSARIEARLDGEPISTRPVPASDPLSHTRELADFDRHEMQIDIPAKGERGLVVRFHAEPVERHQNMTAQVYSDGLLRLAWKRTVWEETDDIAYPLWPAVGFGGGVGEMSVDVQMDSGAELLAWGAAEAVAWAPHPQDPHRVHTTVPPASRESELAFHTVSARYPRARPRTVSPGLSLFAAAAFAPDHGVHASLRGSADLVFLGKGALSLAAETDLSRNAALLLGVQRGAASAYGSAYVCTSFITTLTPQRVFGAELGAGARIFFVPLDVAVQIYPAQEQARGVDMPWLRVLLGLKLGL